jgi:glucose/arabinose dehydrogenase/PKD repeat protein
MYRWLPLVLIVAGALVPAAARAQTTLPAGFSESTVWSGLIDPTAIRFAPDGHVYVAGKGGLVYELDGLDDPTPRIYADLRANVHHGWDRGLLGLAVDRSGRVFVSYTYDKDPATGAVPAWNDGCPDSIGFNTNGCAVLGRLSRLNPDGSEHPLLEDFCAQFPSHSIGTLAFGPDGMLYMGAGDGASYNGADYGQSGAPPNPCDDPPGGRGVANAPPNARGGALRAQSYRRPAGDPISLDGAILRLDPETGAAAAGNPPNIDPKRRPIVAYGFRNPFRFTFRPGTSEIWAGDVGWSAWEEIDRIVPDGSKARNYGWPCYEGRLRQDSYDALGLDMCTSLYSDGPGAVEAPFYTYSHHDHVVPDDPCPIGSSSLSGIAFYGGSMFPPAYRDALLFADYSRNCIWVMHAGADGVPNRAAVETFASGTFAVDLQVGPDGALYYPDIVTGEIRRIAYREPVARIDVSPAGGRRFDFDGSRSAPAVSYAWDLDGDGAYDDSTSPRPSFEYTHDGPVTVRLRVTDAGGATGTASRRIEVGTPPSAEIETPAPGTSWAVGDAIAFSGSGPNLAWGLDIHHCSRTQPTSCHVHHLQDFAGSSGSFAAPDHEYPSYLELTMTATDADKLTTTRSVRLDPKTADVTLTSVPPGLRLAFASETAATPFTRTVIACSATTVTAPSPQSLAAATYTFGGWGDGFAQAREVRAPFGGQATYDATFERAGDEPLAGTAAVGGNVSTAWPGGGEAYRMKADVTGPALALRLYLDAASTASKLVLGLYTDAGGDASALLGAGTLDAPAAGAWNEVRLDAPVPLVAGRRYWIGILIPVGSAGELKWRDRAGAADNERTSRDSDLTALPPVWETRTLYPAGGPASASAVGRPAASPLAGEVAAPACDRSTPAAPAGAPRVAARPARPKLPRLTVPARLKRKGNRVAVPVACPPVAGCRFTVRIGKRSASKTVKAGRKATIYVRAPKARRVRVTIIRRTDGRTDIARRYALISGRAGSASRATSAA